MIIFAFVVLIISLLADFVTTRAGIKRGAKESGPVKSAIGQAIVGLVIVVCFYYASFVTPLKHEWITVVIMLVIAVTRFYAAWHNNKVARR